MDEIDISGGMQEDMVLGCKNLFLGIFVKCLENYKSGGAGREGREYPSSRARHFKPSTRFEFSYTT